MLIWLQNKFQKLSGFQLGIVIEGDILQGFIMKMLINGLLWEGN